MVRSHSRREVNRGRRVYHGAPRSSHEAPPTHAKEGDYQRRRVAREGCSHHTADGACTRALVRCVLELIHERLSRRAAWYAAGKLRRPPNGRSRMVPNQSPCARSNPDGCSAALASPTSSGAGLLARPREGGSAADAGAGDDLPLRAFVAAGTFCRSARDRRLPTTASAVQGCTRAVFERGTCPRRCSHPVSSRMAPSDT
jgi:hypothetical protein